MYNYLTIVGNMNTEKLKLIIKNLESLVDCLKSEVYSDLKHNKKNYNEITYTINDYDEVFYDDLFESEVNQKYKHANDNNGDGL